MVPILILGPILHLALPSLPFPLPPQLAAPEQVLHDLLTVLDQLVWALCVVRLSNWPCIGTMCDTVLDWPDRVPCAWIWHVGGLWA